MYIQMGRRMQRYTATRFLWFCLASRAYMRGMSPSWRDFRRAWATFNRLSKEGR